MSVLLSSSIHSCNNLKYNLCKDVINMPEANLVEKVDRDPALSGAEKETTLTMMGDEKKFEIYSAKPTIIKSLLQHNHFEIVRARVMNESGQERISDRNKLADINGDIVAIKGKMPVGTLSIKYKPRVNNHQSNIISTDTVDSSVFEDSE